MAFDLRGRIDHLIVVDDADGADFVEPRGDPINLAEVDLERVIVDPMQGRIAVDNRPVVEQFFARPET
jgi:hypothetical protein